MAAAPVHTPQSSASTTEEDLPENDQRSYLRTLADLISKISSTMSEIEKNDRNEIGQLERNYTLLSKEAAGMMRSKGNWVFGAAIVSITVFAGSFAFKNANDQKFIQLVSEKMPNIANLFDSRKESGIKIKEALASLEMTRLQDKNGKIQSDSGSMDKFLSVLQSEIQRLRSASASAG